MRNISAFTVLAALTLLPTFLLHAQENTPPKTERKLPKKYAKITFEETKIDVGDVRRGTIHNLVFKFKNTGTLPLDISRVRPTCGCTSLSKFERKIAPGESGELAIQLITTRLGGTIEKRIDVMTNDPTNPCTNLFVKATIVKTFGISPNLVAFGQVDEDQSLTKTVKLTNLLKDPVKITKVSCANPVFQLDLKTIEEHKRWDLTVTTKTPYQVGKNIGTILIEYEGGDGNPERIQASAYLPEPMMLVPNRVFFSRVPTGRIEKRRITLTCREGESASLSEVKCSRPEVTVHVEEKVKGRIFNIHLEFPEGFDIPWTETVTVTGKTTHPFMPFFSVECHPYRRMSPRPVAIIKQPKKAPPSDAKQ